MGYSYVSRSLAQGSVPQNGTPLGREFDVVVLCAREHQRIHLPGVEVINCPLDDSLHPPTAEEITTAWATARRVARRLKSGKRVLANDPHEVLVAECERSRGSHHAHRVLSTHALER